MTPNITPHRLRIRNARPAKFSTKLENILKGLVRDREIRVHDAARAPTLYEVPFLNYDIVDKPTLTLSNMISLRSDPACLDLLDAADDAGILPVSYLFELQRLINIYKPEHIRLASEEDGSTTGSRSKRKSPRKRKKEFFCSESPQELLAGAVSAITGHDKGPELHNLSSIGLSYMGNPSDRIFEELVRVYRAVIKGNDILSRNGFDGDGHTILQGCPTDRTEDRYRALLSRAMELTAQLPIKKAALDYIIARLRNAIWWQVAVPDQQPLCFLMPLAHPCGGVVRDLDSLLEARLLRIAENAYDLWSGEGCFPGVRVDQKQGESRDNQTLTWLTPEEVQLYEYVMLQS